MSHYDCKECDASPHEDHAPSCSKHPIPEWALKEAVARLNAGGHYMHDGHAAKVVARLIAKYEEPPVDPDVEALKRVFKAYGLFGCGEFFDSALVQFKKEIAAAKERG